METKQVAWLAGLLEGEGTFTADAKRGRYQTTYRLPKIRLAMTDRDVVERAHSLLVSDDGPARGVKSNSVRRYAARGDTRKPVFALDITGRRAIEWMLTLFPLMGERRRRRIREIVIRWRDYQPAKTGRKPGFKMSAESRKKIAAAQRERWARARA